MRLLIMGPPWAGKGSQAKLIGLRYHIFVISTGDIFRAMQTSTSALAQQVRSALGPIDSMTARIVAGLDPRQRRGLASPFVAYGG